ncbi:MAG: hypothetical protein ACUVTG_09420, partial [Candidatus Oleimicrobiaceae bacterium]
MLSSEPDNLPVHLLAQVSENLLACQDLDGLLDELIRGAVSLMSCHQASLMLCDSQTHRLSCKRVWGFEAVPVSEPRL